MNNRFLKRTKKINLLMDYVLFPMGKKTYENIIVQKFITPEFKLKDFIERIVLSITGFVEVRVAFSMLTQKDNINESEEKLRYIWAQRCLCINDTTKIESITDFTKLQDELVNLSYSQMLNKQFVKTCELCDMQKSGIIPRRLLSVVVHLTKFD